MRRRLFNFAAAVSLLIFVATASLFFLPSTVTYVIYSTGDAGSSRGEFAVSVTRGLLVVSIIADWKPVPVPAPSSNSESYESDLTQGVERGWTHMGVSYFSAHWTVTHELNQKSALLSGNWGHISNVEVSAFLLLLISSLPLVVAARKLVVWTRAIFRRPEGHCRRCGYNLTGNTSGICPECGTPVGEKAGAKA